jgi:hypothetical protein
MMAIEFVSHSVRVFHTRSYLTRLDEIFARFKVLTAVTVSWDVVPHTFIDRHRYLQLFPLFLTSSSICLNHLFLGHLILLFPLNLNCDTFVCFCGLFYDGFSIANHIPSDGMMNYECEMIWKEADPL